MVGGVLVERPVKDVLPALEYNYQQVDIEVYLYTAQTSFPGLSHFSSSVSIIHGSMYYTEREPKN